MISTINLVQPQTLNNMQTHEDVYHCIV